MKGLRIRVQGRVQGVFFRNWTVEAAEALGLTGSVRNRTDGSVEILAYGDEPALEALVERCREGPRSARVENLEVSQIQGDAPERFTREATS